MGYQDIKELIKDAKGFAEGANDLKLKSKLLDIQEYLYDLLDENRKLRLENEKMKNDKSTEDELIKCGWFWKLPGKDYYYCSRCWGKDHKLVVCNKFMYSDVQCYKCPVCKEFAEIGDQD